MQNKEWYREDISRILCLFNTSQDRGLTENRVLDLRKKYGENILSQAKVKTKKEIFISQFKSPLIYVLIVAELIVLALGDVVEGGIILFIIILNSIIGTFQEGKAQNTLAALRRMVKSYATVIREGREIRIPDVELVPGDIVLLKDGESIGADSRIIESNSLKVNESSLTGESSAVTKTDGQISAVNLGTSDQVNMVFRGTYVVSGLAKVVVVRTGIHTVIGKISRKLTNLNIDVPLKKNIENLSKVLVWIVLLSSLAIFVVGISNGHAVVEMFETVVAIAVSAIPESLPVVVTLILATGVWRMSQQNVLVKRLQAVEALGQAKVIALDKTGTITKNQMAVEKVFTDGKMYDVSGSGYEPTGEIFLSAGANSDKKQIDSGEQIDVPKNSALDLIMKVSAFTSIAEILKKTNPEKPGDIDYVLSYGDPTEASLLVLAQKFGYEKEKLLKKYPQVLEIPFDMENKHHTTVNDMGDANTLFVAGSPEVILDKCDRGWVNDGEVKIDKALQHEYENAINDLSKEGYRVLALAIKNNSSEKVDGAKLPELTLVGFVGIADTIRDEVEAAVQSVRNAGMRVAMITGDHVQTAEAIATKVGIFRPGDKVMSGRELKELNDEQLMHALDNVTVFARVSPDDKMRIIESYKRRGETVAMTGDGVNDALSLVSADLGVAMGKIGTEVAQEASDIVLLDDDFGDIVSAAEEGRNIYFTVRKSVVYLLATNLGELLVIMLAIFADMPLPLLATQIIWLNLVTDTFLVAALAFEPKEKNLMDRTFRKPSKYLLDKFMALRIVLVASLMTIVTLWMFTQYMNVDMVKAWTVSLTVLTVFQWYNIFNVRSSHESVFKSNILSNKYLIAGLFMAILMHMFAIYNPFMQSLLQTTGLNLAEWGIIMLVGVSIIVVEEVRKLIYRLFVK
jgi:Ca2+-transporting ATPase